MVEVPRCILNEIFYDNDDAESDHLETPNDGSKNVV